MTPLYDVLTAQPSLDAHQVHKKQIKLAMFVGDNRHYVIDYIKGRHFVQTTERAGLSRTIAVEALNEIRESAQGTIATVGRYISSEAFESIHLSVSKALQDRLQRDPTGAAKGE